MRPVVAVVHPIVAGDPLLNGNLEQDLLTQPSQCRMLWLGGNDIATNLYCCREGFCRGFHDPTPIHIEQSKTNYYRR